jgi:glycosyltransferase involved in cell wall biosynthesis
VESYCGHEVLSHKKTKMRFALLTSTFYPTLGGAEKQLDLLARGLLARGHSVRVFAPWVKGRNNAVNAPYEVERYPRLRTRRFGLRWAARFLWKAHQDQPLDVVHAHGAYPAAYMAMDFCRRAGVPLVVRAHGGDVLPGEAIDRDAWLRGRMRRALASADLIIAQNAEFVTLLGDLSGHPGRVVRVGNGVEAEAYAAEAGPNPHVGGPPVVLTLSTFYAKKGLDVLLDAWPRVMEQCPGAQLHLAGHGPDGGALRAQVDRLGIGAGVQFLGDVKGEDKKARLQACAVYVSSARREVFSNALLEALAAGCRLVATAVGANVEVLETTGAGELVPAGDAAALAAALVRAIKAGRPALDADARVARVGPYTVDASIDRYCAAVAEMLERRRV